MALTGETIATGAPTTCPDCEIVVKLEVLQSAGGYYIGSICACGPYSRESIYFKTIEEATVVFMSGQYER